MAVNPVQLNTETKQTTYRDAKTPIKTNRLVHPLPAEGHLVHDSLLSVPKFWMKDIAYDIKAIKDGLTGKANDHQTGRLNDVGLKLGGIGIATYLATQTTDPKKRIMEYIGLGAFLASMQLYPLIAINAPSRAIQGFDIGKEYIDDYGRKKSVFQDGNYVPFDMYRGEFTGEDLNIIGDRMGIPRDIKNRDELIKEQMRKIAVQNNTLWMLGAGLATPVMTALICCGLERILSPVMEAAKNKHYNSSIKHILEETQNMSLNVNDIDSNKLSKKVEKLLTSYKDKELPKEELENLVKLLSNEVDENLTAGIREDINKLLKSGKNAFVLSDNITEELGKVISESSTGRNKVTFKETFTLTKAEIEQALRNVGSDGKYINSEQLYSFKDELKKLFASKIEASKGNKDALYMEQSNILENISKAIQKHPSYFVSENNIKDITDFAKVMGDFKLKEHTLDKCKLFKVEYSPETVLARSYSKFENALFGSLNIKYNELKQMKESEKFAKEILEKKIQALVNDKEKYAKTIEKLAKIMSETEVRLHGNSDKESYIKDLISAYENAYNYTAKRINNIGAGKFSKTINKLIKEDVNGELTNSIKDRQDLFDLIDGFRKPFDAGTNDYDARALKTAEEMSKGVGSSKELAITRLIDRIQDVTNTERRMLHVLDMYNREVPQNEYDKHLNQRVKDALLEAISKDHVLKLYTDNNPKYYQDIMNTGWNKDLITDATRTSVEKTCEYATGDTDNIKNERKLRSGNVFERFEKYIERTFDLAGQNDLDYRKPAHKVGENINSKYHVNSFTRNQFYQMIAQSPIDFFKKAARTRFENQKWLRTASGIGAGILAGTVLVQFCFGKIKNPHNIQKQVNNDKNS